MSERLIQLVNNALIKKGMKAVRAASGLSPNTIRNVAERKTVPRRRSAYRLALACDAVEEDALKMARECDPNGAKETA